jgi:hypothetical protein
MRLAWAAGALAFMVPAAAVGADVVTFTPLSLQPETDALLYTPLAVIYLPLWVLLVAAGIGARRLRRPTVAAD